MEGRECAGGPLTGDYKIGGSMNLVVWKQKGLGGNLDHQPAVPQQFNQPFHGRTKGATSSPRRRCAGEHGHDTHRCLTAKPFGRLQRLCDREGSLHRLLVRHEQTTVSARIVVAKPPIRDARPGVDQEIIGLELVLDASVKVEQRRWSLTTWVIKAHPLDELFERRPVGPLGCRPGRHQTEPPPGLFRYRDLHDMFHQRRTAGDGLLHHVNEIGHGSAGSVVSFSAGKGTAQFIVQARRSKSRSNATTRLPANDKNPAAFARRSDRPTPPLYEQKAMVCILFKPLNRTRRCRG